MPHAWLGPLCAARIRPDAPLPDSDEAELGGTLTSIYPALLRLSAAMSTPKSSQGDQPARPYAEMSEAVSRAGASLEWVRDERQDLMPPDGAEERHTWAQYDYLRETAVLRTRWMRRGIPWFPRGRRGRGTCATTSAGRWGA